MKLQRYELTGTCGEVFTVEQIMQALRKANATRVNKRRAFGWSNQPHVATFAAMDDSEAITVCNVARGYLPNPDSLPSLLPFGY